MTVAEALAAARRTLQEAGVPDAALDAELLLRHVLGWDRARLLVDSRAELPAGAQAPLDGMIGRRAQRIPLQHITGRQAFWRHEFVVTPDVLSPRPETEHLVEAALEWLGGRPRARIADVGTGSGCIAVSLAAECRDALVVAVDVSPAALAVARGNAQRLGAPVAAVRADLLEAFAPGGLDLVVSNPPYVEAADLAGLQPEVRDHEPRLALVPPDGPRGIYGRLAQQAARVLPEGGAIAVEVGAGQAAMVAGLFADAGLEPRQPITDLGGTPRVVLAIRR